LKRIYLISAALTVGIVLVGYIIMSGIDKPAAIVNGEPISEEILQRALSSKSLVHVGTGANISSEAIRSSVLEQLISEVLLLQGAREAGVTVSDEEIAAELKRIKEGSTPEAYREFLRENAISEEDVSVRIRDNMMKQRFVDEHLFKKDLTEEEIRDFYKDSPVPFMTQGEVEIRIVELETLEEAEAAIKEMRSHKQDGFDKVAERLMKDERVFVSEYGKTNPSFYPGEVGQAMRDLDEGRFGGPYKGKEGYFLVNLRKRLPERPKTFEEARQEIEALLMERRRSASIIHWVANQRNNSKIVRN